MKPATSKLVFIRGKEGGGGIGVSVQSGMYSKCKRQGRCGGTVERGGRVLADVKGMFVQWVFVQELYVRGGVGVGAICPGAICPGWGGGLFVQEQYVPGGVGWGLFAQEPYK